MPRDLLYKRNAIRECLRAGRRQVFRLQVAKDADVSDGQDILDLARKHNVKTETTTKEAISSAAHGERHQNMLLEVGDYPYVDLEDLLARAEQRHEMPFLLLLDLVQDPRNVGAILRTAEAMGVHGIIIQERRGCEITPTVVNTSAGATEHLLVAQVTNLAETMRRLKQHDIWMMGLGLADDAQDFAELDLNLPLGIVIGNEGVGLRRLIRDRCDFIAKLPMYGKVQSLNAAVAGSLALYAARTARAR